MAFNFFRIFMKDDGTNQRLTRQDIACKELGEIAQRIAIRQLAFDTCVNMVSRYIASCEFKTYREKKPTKSEEYYHWNIEPNENQNKTMFINKLVRQLYVNNEALVIETSNGGLVVADDFTLGPLYPQKQNTYTGVTVGEVSYSKTFREKEVMHLKLAENPIQPVLDAIYDDYYTLVASAMESFNWNSGKHWKVHVDQIAAGDEEFTKNFAEMVESRIKPFLSSNKAILPEFDGYNFEDVSESRSTRSTTGESADIRNLIEDIFDFTAEAFGIPSVLVKGKVENTSDAKLRFYTLCDTVIAQIAQEANRKRYGYAEWAKGNYLRIDSSNTEHFSLLDNSANLEKVIGSAVYSVNDILSAIGQPTINEPWADAHYLTKNIGNLSESVLTV